VDRAQSGLTTKMLDRPAGGDMMRLIEEGDIVIVQDVDRLGRDVFDILATVQFIKSRCRLCVINMMGMEVDTDTMGGKLILMVWAWSSEWAARVQKEKAAQGRANRKAKGLTWPGQPGYGYRMAGQEGQRHHVPNDKEQRIVNLILDLRAKRWASTRIASALKRAGVRMPNGREINHNLVRKIIKRNRAGRKLPGVVRDSSLYPKPVLEQADLEFVQELLGKESA
jgi:DNA invertase Pin-like site-specific DNA recombinase